MNWEEKVQAGMKLIIEGCKENTDWTKCCSNCPFDDFCSAIWGCKDFDYTTPDTWENEGLTFAL